MNTIKIAKVQVLGGKRALSESAVAELADSIKALGLLNPISVSENGVLVAGNHRLEAYKLLGRTEIPCTVVSFGEMEGDKAALTMRLMEIDENLVRNDLTVLDRAEQTQRRKIVYEHLHPEAPKGPGRPEKNAETVSAFTTDTAKKAGVTPRSVRHSVQIAESITPEAREIIRPTQAADSTRQLLALAKCEPAKQVAVAEKVAGGMKVKDAVREVKREALVAANPPSPPDGKRVRLFNCPISELAGNIEAESIDAIISDPPYDSILAFADLADFARYALKDGGSLFAMTGQFHLPAILDLMMKGEKLLYWWTLAYLTPGGKSPQIFPRRVNTFWKPVLWFVKGELAGDRWHGDVVKSAVNDNDKRYHDWGQSVSGFTELIEKHTEPGDTVCDPFLGGGTTGVAAMTLGRFFVGAEKDSDAFGIAQARIAEAIREQG